MAGPAANSGTKPDDLVEIMQQIDEKTRSAAQTAELKLYVTARIVLLVPALFNLLRTRKMRRAGRRIIDLYFDHRPRSIRGWNLLHGEYLTLLHRGGKQPER